MRLRKRSMPRRVLMILLVAFGHPTYTSLFLAAFPILFGWLLNIITYGVLRKKKNLITHGPYAFVRNPFYIGTFVSDAGMCIAANPLNITIALITVAYFSIQFFTYGKQMLSEEKELSRLFGEEYRLYCERTPRLIPSLLAGIRFGGLHLGWSFDTALHNRVFSRAFGVLLWFTFMLTAYTITPAGSPIVGGDVNFRRLLADGLLSSVVVGAFCVHTMFKVLENAHREEEKRVASS